MKQKLVLKILIGILTLVVLSLFLIKVVLEPWIGKQIQAEITNSNKDFIVEIGKVHTSMWNSGLELENIAIRSKPELKDSLDLIGEIASIRVKGINLTKAIFKNDIAIREVIVLNSTIKGRIAFSDKIAKPKISPLNIRIDSLFFDKTNLEIKNTLSAKTCSVKDGVLKVYDLNINKLDTISVGLFNHFSFDVQELLAVSTDSMYTYTATGINYAATSNTLTVDSFSICPNYSDYEFTARHELETDCIRVGFGHISAHNFSVEGYLKSGDLVSSYIEIGNVNLSAFRDKRKKDQHITKPPFQEMIYNYPGSLRVDSIGIIKGNIVYTEHAEKANEPGKISFQEIHAKIYNLTNDTIYKTKEAFFKVKVEALLMGKGKLTVLLKNRIFNKLNTFSIDGTLSGMEVKELNPMLERNAFIFATSGKIDAMDFSLTANNTKATGKMNLRYHGLNIAVKNKRTDDTTAIKERFISIIANRKILNSNPLPGEAVRIGIIDLERDPERFLFNYSFKSILTGIKSSLVKGSKK